MLLVSSGTSMCSFMCLNRSVSYDICEDFQQQSCGAGTAFKGRSRSQKRQAASAPAQKAHKATSMLLTKYFEKYLNTGTGNFYFLELFQVIGSREVTGVFISVCVGGGGVSTCLLNTGKY